MNTQTLIANAVFYFVLLNGFFLLLGWYTQFDGDITYRKKLDDLLDKSEKSTVFNVLIDGIRLFYEKISKLISAKIVKYLYLPAALYLFNVIIYFYVTFFRLKVGETNLHDFHIASLIRNSPNCSGYYNPLYGVLLAPVLLTLLSIVSVAITIFLLRRATNATSKFRFFIIILMDFFLCVLFLVFVRKFSFLVFGFGRAVGTFRDCDLADFMPFYIQNEADLFVWFGQNFTVYDLYPFFGLSSVVLTVSYVVIMFMLLIVMTLPNVSKRFLFLITTGNKPVFTQLGLIFGSFASVFSAFIDYLKL